MANLLFAFRESDSLRSENPGMSQPSRGLVSDRDSRLGPPMEVCAGFELIAIENTTALGDDLLEIGQGLEVPVGEWLILASGSSWRVAHLGEWLILASGSSWRVAHPGRATGVLRAEARGSSRAGRPAGGPRAQPGSVGCASRRCRARAR